MLRGKGRLHTLHRLPMGRRLAGYLSKGWLRQASKGRGGRHRLAKKCATHARMRRWCACMR